MTAKITVMYDVPMTGAGFEASFDEHLALATRIPGLQRVLSHRVWPTEHETPRLAYRLVELFFTDPGALRDAMGTREAQNLFPSMLDVGASGVHVVYRDVGS